MTKQIERLDNAIDALLANRAYPHDTGLEELLKPAQLLMATPVPGPNQRTAQARLNQALVAQRQHPPAQWLATLRGLLHPKKLVPLAFAAAMLFLIYLSAIALPGDMLYPIKQTTTNIDTYLPRTEKARTAYYLNLSEKQLVEIEELVTRQMPVPTEALYRYRSTWHYIRTHQSGSETAILTRAENQAKRWQLIQPELGPNQQSLGQEIMNLLRGNQKSEPQQASPSPAPPHSNKAKLTPEASATPTATPEPKSTASLAVPAQSNSHPPTQTQPLQTKTPPSGPHTLTPTPSPTRKTLPPTSAPTHTPTATHPRTHSPTQTPTPSQTITPGATATATGTPTPTGTPHSPHPTRSPSSTPQPSKTPRPQKTPKPKKTHTPEPPATKTHK